MFIRQQEKTLTSPEAIAELCNPLGIYVDHWDVSALGPEICRMASVNPEYGSQILDCFRESLEALKQRQGYLTEDIISLSPETPNLDTILAKFDKEHHHTDDEVRGILYGNGIFGIVPPDAEPFEIHVEAGDLIVVPAYTRHWFTLKEDREIVALRVFKTPEGWVALYEPVVTSGSAVG
jgi:1,2-dihydroxy-3-keto-5-methylthiopentene dioxygenase